MKTLRAIFVLAAGLVIIPSAMAVIVVDNGSGTAHMNIRADYLGQSPMTIIDGLQAGSQINIDAVMNSPVTTLEIAGGTLGGTKSSGNGAPLFTWNMQGTGVYAGYVRSLSLPMMDVTSEAGISPGDPEVHSAPRTNGASVQSYDTVLFRLFSQITGDADFDLLRVSGGTDFGLPSPGHTTLTQSGSNWDVNSFFDLTYRIDFVGRAGGPFTGRSGSTTNTVRLLVIPEPVFAGLLAPALLIFRRRRR